MPRKGKLIQERAWDKTWGRATFRKCKEVENITKKLVTTQGKNQQSQMLKNKGENNFQRRTGL